MAVRSKMSDQNQIFYINLRVFKNISIFFLHLFGVGKTQILWKKVFQKIQDGTGMKNQFKPPS
jgi:hypothetical protein